MKSHDFSREVKPYNAVHLLCEHTYIVFRSDRKHMNKKSHLPFRGQNYTKMIFHFLRSLCHRIFVKMSNEENEWILIKFDLYYVVPKN